ncbi:LPS export ABC transporter periplasmic protein LptC [Flavobacterium psychrotolerans]|uniref:LPS export ABC transporter periplasmic protein LptC n=1 Tax=Flavobacterium psychrotolerans TaxID=2169410 RepID=A0A2U1JL40_9FLAO|nr:LPS export ABC transporter periplasmic protein LptC [Flavobacterium psychrotolerans]PWA05694.1 LPS export ABC transporter periplasmic protein LptC [Flavobacterium psychrotolerans]
MNFINHKLVFFVFLITTVSVFIGCESNFKEVQKINYSEFTPNGEADNFNLKYTDSGRIKSILISPKMLDYSNVEFPFTEFPKGIDVTLYDSKAKKTFITSDYAISFKGTDIIDLQGHVKIATESGQFLETEQLYFDQKNEWFFTEKKFKFTDPKGVSFGEGIDFSKDFKIVNSQKITGAIDQAE